MGRFLIKKKSKIHRNGIFTNKKIEKRDKFYIIPLDKVYNKPKKHCARIRDNRYVDDKIVLNHINHSCDSNTKICFRGKIGLKALRDIKKGEEITVNYGKTELKKNKLKCNCKSKNCKKYFYRGE